MRNIDDNFNIEKYPKWVQKKYNNWCKEKAIKNIEKKLKLQQKTINDFTQEEIDEIVADEIKNVKKNHGWNSFRALLALVGLDWLISQ